MSIGPASTGLKLKHNRRAGKGTTEFYGFYGCSQKVMLILWIGKETKGKVLKPLQARELKCPGCNRNHRTNVLWRRRQKPKDPADQLGPPDLVITQARDGDTLVKK